MSRVDFSDRQGGKGAADRLAARCKAHVRAFINEGHDVCTANELKNGLLLHGRLDGVRVVSLDAIDETPDESQTISGITKLNNFEFSPIQLPVGTRIASAAEEPSNQTRSHLVRMQTVMGL